MLKQLFAAMNDLLDDIIRYYPRAKGEVRIRLDEQVRDLRRLSDTIIDEWLHIEEKLAVFGQLEEDAAEAAAAAPGPGQHASGGMAAADEPDAAEAEAAAAGPIAGSAAADPSSVAGFGGEAGEAGGADDTVTRGQGYFKLAMYARAAELFELAVSERPDSNLPRMFLAMSHMHLRNWGEAQRQFLLLLSLTDHPKWLALGLNALGCIQAAHANMEQAERYFCAAHEADPTFEGPMSNLHSCRNAAGRLTLYFGSSELICL